MNALLALSLAAALATAAGCAAGPGSDPLAWTLGSWRGERCSGGDPKAAPAERRPIHVEVVRAIGGVHVERLQVDLGTGHYTGFQVQVPAADGTRWHVRYANDARAGIADLIGQRAGDRFTIETADAAAVRRTRMVWHQPEPDRWLRTQHRSDDGGRTWSVLFRDELVRDHSGGVTGSRTQNVLP